MMLKQCITKRSFMEENLNIYSIVHVVFKRATFINVFNSLCFKRLNYHTNY